MIQKNITIEELVDIFPPSAGFLSEYGIRCMRCGEPSWGTIESAAKEKNISDVELNEIIDKLNIEYTKYKKERKQ